MEQDKRQKKMAGHCDLGMCGSIACLFIRSAEVRDIDRDYAFAEYAEARQLDAFANKCKCTSDCGFQDVCKRLEVAVRHRDLCELEYAIDNRTGNRTERMDIRDAGADDHEADTLEMGAGGICNDYHNECDSAWDGVEDTRMVLWAGAGDLVGCRTALEDENKGRIVHLEEVGYWPNTNEKKFYFVRHPDNRVEYSCNLPKGADINRIIKKHKIFQTEHDAIMYSAELGGVKNINLYDKMLLEDICRNYGYIK